MVLGDTEAWQRDPGFAGLQRVGGVDVSFARGDRARACAALVVLSYPELEVTAGTGRDSRGPGHSLGCSPRPPPARGHSGGRPRRPRQ